MPGGFFPRHLVLDCPSPELSFHPSKIKQKLASVMESIEGASVTRGWKCPGEGEMNLLQYIIGTRQIFVE